MACDSAAPSGKAGTSGDAAVAAAVGARAGVDGAHVRVQSLNSDRMKGQGKGQTGARYWEEVGGNLGGTPSCCACMLVLWACAKPRQGLHKAWG